MRSYWFLVGCILALQLTAQSGLIDEMEAQEAELVASTKQINQFFHRFNGEEDKEGNRLYPQDKKYRDPKLRQKFLPELFDQASRTLKPNLIQEFIAGVSDKRSPTLLDFHQSEWVAEVNTLFTYKGKEVSILLFMALQPQGQGYEWIIKDISFDQYKAFFQKDTSENKQFIHPMSHELQFMNLRKAFANNANPEEYTAKDYRPDYLTLFLYELKKEQLKFVSVKNMRFHFFDLSGWYFEVANFNRSGYNSGWLISNLVQANPMEMEMIREYIYDKN